MRTEEEQDERSGLSAQQKIWKGAGTFFYAAKPLILYLTLPALLMCAGMALSGGRTAEDMMARSGHFYHALGILLTLYLLHRQSRKRGQSLAAEATFEWRGLKWRRVLLLAGAGAAAAVFVSALLTVLPIPEFLMGGYERSSGGLNEGTDQVLALLSTVLLAPVTEELIFRGYFLNRLLGWFDERQAVILSSAVFALCHVSVIWILYAFVMGLALAQVSIREDNIAYSIALHVGFNLNVLPVWLINRSPAARELLFDGRWKAALYGAAAGALAVWLLRQYREEIRTW